MGSKLGSRKRSAKNLGLSFDEYIGKIETGQKHCMKCRCWLPINLFGIDRSRGDGRAATCKQCRDPRKGDTPSKPERQAMKRQGLSWCRGCKAWLSSEKIKSGVCTPHATEEARLRYQNNAEYGERKREYIHARKRNMEPIPPEVKEQVLERFDNACVYCGKPPTTFDHITPVVKDGSAKAWNIVPCCVSCNSSKNDSNVWDWLEKKGTIRTIHRSFYDHILLEWVI